MEIVSRKISIAPMMACTDRHFRYLARLVSRHVLLYTEMLTPNAILYGDRQRLLGFDPVECPLALQLGGSDPALLAKAARVAEQWHYAEVNLNVGCPSDRVQSGQFGACLMKEPQRVADCVVAMRETVNIPVTVKSRIGVDDCDSYAELVHFVETIWQAGCRSLTVHARKAWLQGLSPRQNRHLPPLRYDVVYQLKRDFPDLEIIINGGIKDDGAISQHLALVDGVMIGREAFRHLYWLSQFDRRYFNDNHAVLSRKEILLRYLPYVSEQLAKGVPLRIFVKPMLGLFQGVSGAKSWRHFLCEQSRHPKGWREIESKIKSMV